MKALFKVLLVVISCFYSCGQKQASRIYNVMSLDGSEKLFTSGEKGLLLLFLAPDCPFSLSSTPELIKLHNDFPEFNIVGIIPGKLYTKDEVEEYVKSYQINFPVLFDADYRITRELKASVMPEAFVLNKSGKILYKGAIDSKAFDIGKTKISAEDFYVKNVLEMIRDNREVTQPDVPAHGCFIE